MDNIDPAQASLVDSAQAADRAHSRLAELLHSANPETAVAYVESLSWAPEYERTWRELLAIAYTEGGSNSWRRDLVERGTEIWRDLDANCSPHTAYNRANAELTLWEIAAREDGMLSAWENHRDHLNEARSLFERVGHDESAPAGLRVQALTNAGNSFDMLGRDVDAIALYDQALAIDPTFAMALGNRALALIYFVPFMRGHSRQVQAQAAADLQLALQNLSEQRTVSPRVRDHFRAALETLPADLPLPTSVVVQWDDPYLQWCARESLFLHVWPRVLSEDTQYLDPLFIESLAGPMAGEGLDRLYNLVDAFNTLKQDYIAARYSLWLSSDPLSPIVDHAARISTRTLLIDSRQDARWGTRTGMLIQAHASSTNVLDKIAGFVHLYFQTGRVRNVSFRLIDRAKTTQPIDQALRTAIARPESNIGLTALLDLSHDLTRRTALAARVDRRNKATHRFVVAHNWMVPPSHNWLVRVNWLDLVDEATMQLQTARAALIYLARMIARHEAVSCAHSDEHSVKIQMAADPWLSESM